MNGFRPSRRAVLAMPGILAAAAPAPSDMEAALDALMRNAVPSHGAGAAIAVVKDGRTTFQRGYGLASVELGVPIGTDTVFHVASVSKQFTAMAIALLVEEGKLRLEDEVHRFVPDLPDYGARVEVQHLVHHTSGVCDQWAAMQLAGWRDGDLFTQEDVLTVLRRVRSLDFAPGTKFDYSNGGYTLLAAIVERVSGMSLRRFSEERMFGPLGMTRSFWHDDIHEVVAGRAASYTMMGNTPRFLPLNLGTVGATGMNTTVEDLARWDGAFYGGAVFSPAVLAMATAPTTLADGAPNAYRFGLVAGRYRGLPTIGHAGADAGFRSNLLRFPEQRFTVILLCNNDTLDVAGLPHAVADLVLQNAFSEPAPAHAAAFGAPAASSAVLAPEQAARFAGSYRDDAGKGYYVSVVGQGLALDTDTGASPLVPSGAGRFRAALAPLIVIFSGDANGHAAELRIEGARQATARRQPDAAYTASELGAMAGTYRSDELDTVFHFVPNGGTLSLAGLKMQAARLPLYARDLFGGPDGMRLRFVRDAQGAPNAVLAILPHLPEIRFDRLG